MQTSSSGTLITSPKLIQSYRDGRREPHYDGEDEFEAMEDNDIDQQEVDGSDEGSGEDIMDNMEG